MGHTGKRRKRALSARAEEEYRRIYRLHIEPHIRSKAIAALAKADISKAVEEIRKATSDTSKGQRGTQALKALKIIRPVCEYAIDNE